MKKEVIIRLQFQDKYTVRAFFLFIIKGSSQYRHSQKPIADQIRQCRANSMTPLDISYYANPQSTPLSHSFSLFLTTT